MTCPCRTPDDIRHVSGEVQPEPPMCSGTWCAGESDAEHRCALPAGHAGPCKETP